MKNNRFFIRGMSAALLALGLVLAGCDNGSTSTESANKFTLTQISNTQVAEASYTCLVGLFPESTTRATALADAQAIVLDSGYFTDIVAGAFEPQTSGSYDNYTISGPLQSTESGFLSDWRGEGSYHIWFALSSGSSAGPWTLYRTNSPVSLTAGGSISLNAQTDLSKK
ncbi:hypothetical protein [Leadbettera azotonutricia]|uniref:hypothetical protein n=1 Tax=Leadbettera azotonutricia TaxID=150829 RepID=UPI0005C51099|nr:hypothetical protein [Leadbettera azotonutricia]